MLGGACAVAYSKANESGAEEGFMRRMAIVGIVLIVVGYVFTYSGFPWPYGSDNVRTHPVFFALRVGYVFLWAWICWQLQNHPAIPSAWIMSVSRESLLVYVAHIVLLFHLPIGNSTLVRRFGKSLSPLECVGVTLVLILLTWGMAVLWSWLKSHHERRSQYLVYVVGAAAALLFLVR